MDNQQMVADMQRRAKKIGCDWTMVLPEGRTCFVCQSFARCKALLGRSGDEQNCDWSPSRFREDFRQDAARYRWLLVALDNESIPASLHEALQAGPDATTAYIDRAMQEARQHG